MLDLSSVERLSLCDIPYPVDFVRTCVTQMPLLTHLAVLNPSNAHGAQLNLTCLLEKDRPFPVPHLANLTTKGAPPSIIRRILEVDVLSSRRLHVFMHVDGLALEPSATKEDFRILNQTLSWLRDNCDLEIFGQPSMSLYRSWEALEERAWQDHSKMPVELSEETVVNMIAEGN